MHSKIDQLDGIYASFVWFRRKALRRDKVLTRRQCPLNSIQFTERCRRAGPGPPVDSLKITADAVLAIKILDGVDLFSNNNYYR